MDPAFEGPQESVPLRPLALGEQQAGQPRDHRERHEQRRQHGEDHGDRERPDVAARSARQEQQRHEREHQGGGGAEHRHPDLPRRENRRPTEPRDVFHHYDRVIHEQAECDHHAHDGELIEREAGPRERDDAHCEG